LCLGTRRCVDPGAMGSLSRMTSVLFRSLSAQAMELPDPVGLVPGLRRPAGACPVEPGRHQDLQHREVSDVPDRVQVQRVPQAGGRHGRGHPLPRAGQHDRDATGGETERQSVGADRGRPERDQKRVPRRHGVHADGGDGGLQQLPRPWVARVAGQLVLAVPVIEVGLGAGHHDALAGGIA
jgi:hypothetical protein